MKMMEWRKDEHKTSFWNEHEPTYQTVLYFQTGPGENSFDASLRTARGQAFIYAGGRLVHNVVEQA